MAAIGQHDEHDQDHDHNPDPAGNGEVHALNPMPPVAGRRAAAANAAAPDWPAMGALQPRTVPGATGFKDPIADVARPAADVAALNAALDVDVGT
jgi:hypothetical protein